MNKVKSIRTYMAIALAVVILLALAGCGGSGIRNGTYTSGGLLSQTWEFSGSNNVTMSTIGGLVSTTGTYSISGNTITITTTMFGTETVLRHTITDITRNSFRIDGTLFTRQ